jgi:hypothetical protein
LPKFSSIPCRICADAPKEILIVADKKEKEFRNDGGYTARTLSQDNPVTDEEASRLIAAAKSRKRYRIPFFNTEDGIKLRLVVAGHETKHIDFERHCALCGNNSTAKGWRGHRSSFLCSTHCSLMRQASSRIQEELLDYMAHI